MISNLTLTPREFTSRRGRLAGPQSDAAYRAAFAGLVALSERLEAGYHLRLGERVITRLDEFLTWAAEGE